MDQNMHAARYAATSAQRRILYFERLRLGSPAYNIVRAFDLEGALDIERLARAFDCVIKRHAALGAGFVDCDGEVWAAPSGCSCAVERIAVGAGVASKPEIERATETFARRPFDTATAPLCRLGAIRRGPDSWRLILSIHHTCMDDVSLGLVVRDWSRFYCELSGQGEMAPADYSDVELGAGYHDFAAWEQEFINSAEAAQRVEALARVLRAAAPTAFATDIIAVDEREARDGRIDLRLSKDLMRSIADFARRNQGTPFMVFYTAFIALLARYSGEREVLSGFAAGNRHHALRSVVGDFVNTLPLHTVVDNQTFQSLYAGVRGGVLRALDSVTVPFDAVVRRAGLSHPSRQPLRAMFLENHPTPLFESEGLKCTPSTPWTGAGKLDVTAILIRERSGGGTLRLEYDRSLFREPMARQIANHLVNLVGEAIENPGLHLESYSISDTAERSELLRRSHGEVVSIPTQSVLDDILAQFAQHPDSIAVVAYDAAGIRMEATYRDLDVRSQQIGQTLVARGVRPGDPVAVLLERGPHLLPAVLGVLRMGAMYFPLDPDYPDERLRFAVEEAGATVVLASRSTAQREVASRDAIIAVEILFNQDLAPTWREPSLSKTSIAYLIYTSGSTGRPKGVVNTHGALCNRLHWMQRVYTIGHSDVVLQKTPISFDVSVWELIWPLMVGAKLVLAKPGGHRDTPYLSRLIAAEAVTVLHFVPSMLRLFLEEAKPIECATIRHLVCSGEALPGDLVEAWHARFAGDIHNLYGPTEAAIDVTAWTCARGAGGASTPIGYPIQNTQIFILNEQAHLCPPGVVGELYIGGENLSIGYLHRSDLTAERFVTRLIGGLAEPRRLYRTGDLGRWRTDGALEFLGRLDDQVKLNGVRIELGEIEAVLREQGDISDAAVTLHYDDQGAPFLAAFIVAPERVVNVETLGAWLKLRLPASFAPAVYQIVAELPRTLSGKIDRKSLPAVVRTRAGSSTNFRPPSTDLESRIAQVWADVLLVDQVGLEDDFFALGGDSLRSLRVAALMRSAGMMIGVEDVLLARTVESLAKRVTQIASGVMERAESQGRERLARVPRLVRTLWLNSQANPDYRTYVTSFHVRSRFCEIALRGALELATERHELLRSSLEFGDEEWPHFRVWPKPSIALEIIDVRGLSANAHSQRLARDLEIANLSKWDWTSPPLCRFAIHLRTNDSFQFTIIEPWLDGWSVQVLATEIFEDYSAALSGSPRVNRPPMRIRFADFAEAEDLALASKDDLEFWAARLHAIEPTLLDIGNSRTTPVQLDVELGDLGSQLRQLAVKSRTPLKSILLAIHMRVLSILTGASTVTSGVMFNGRPESLGTESVLGLYLNALPVSAETTNKSWSELSRDCLREEAEITPRRRFPSDELRRMAGQPMFDAIFNFTDFHILRGLPRNDQFALLDRVGLDQTYMAICVQFGSDLVSGDITLALEVSEALLERIGADHLRRIYVSAIAAACEGFEADVKVWNPLGPDKTRLAAWSGGGAGPPFFSLSEAFLDQAAKAPDAVALRMGAAQLSYGELRSRSEAIAQALADLKVGKGDRVGICLPRSGDAFAAILGVLRLGAVFVLLPVDAPANRLKFIATDAAVMAVIGRATTAIFESTAYLDLDAPLPATGSGFHRTPEARPDDPLHVIYTSGSSDRPKGVLTNHGAVANRLAWMWKAFSFGCDDIVAHKTSLAFVDCIWEIFGGLLQGVPTAIIPEASSQDAATLAAAIAVARCTRLTLVPSVAEAMLRDVQDPGTCLARLKLLILSGEPLRRELVAGLRAHLPQTQLLNLYGSTETTGDATYEVLVDPLPNEDPPIGRPLDGVTIEIVDDRGKVNPIGVVGEIMVSGACLAAGYTGWAAETGALNSRWTESGAWQTGDLGYWRHDGSIAFLGRRDRQLKVRGVRIEPAEIEAALNIHPAVRKSVICLAPGGALVAFVEVSEQIDSDRLRRLVAERLPAIMVPARILTLKALPVSLAGKTDFAALLSHLADFHDVAEEPASAMERVVADAFSEVFADRAVNRTTNFFDAGGHSLSVGSVIVRLRRRLSADLPIRLIFEHPVVSDLAVALDKHCSAQRGAAAV